MKSTLDAKLVTVAIALCAGMLAGCDRTAPAVTPSAVTPSAQIPATVNQPPQLSAKEAATKSTLPPIQGQVDTREPAQRRDFETVKR